MREGKGGRLRRDNVMFFFYFSVDNEEEEDLPTFITDSC